MSGCSFLWQGRKVCGADWCMCQAIGLHGRRMWLDRMGSWGVNHRKFRLPPKLVHDLAQPCRRWRPVTSCD